MGDAVEGHISDRALEGYSLDKLAESLLTVLEEHLRACDRCCARLERIEPMNFVHFTKDGPVYLRATRLTTGKVMARNWGVTIDGGKAFGSVSTARRYLIGAFSRMFPEHTCQGRCGPTKGRGKSAMTASIPLMMRRRAGDRSA